MDFLSSYYVLDPVLGALGSIVTPDTPPSTHLLLNLHLFIWPNHHLSRESLHNPPYLGEALQDYLLQMGLGVCFGLPHPSPDHSSHHCLLGLWQDFLSV